MNVNKRGEWAVERANECLERETVTKESERVDEEVDEEVEFLRLEQEAKEGQDLTKRTKRKRGLKMKRKEHERGPRVEKKLGRVGPDAGEKFAGLRAELPVASWQSKINKGTW